MSDFLTEVAEYLEDNSVTDVFVSVLPDATKKPNCVALFGLIGANPGASRDVPGLQFPRFQAIVRNEVYKDASTSFQAVRTLLHGKLGLILPNWRVLRCHADQDGGPIGQDDKGLFEFSINFTTEISNEQTP